MRPAWRSLFARLSDYFDLIGGTSTGSIIASCLAIGMSVAEIKDMYMELGDKIFGKKYKWWKIFEIDDVLKASYKSKPLEDQLKNVFGEETTLASDKILTGLCIVAKRADTNSVWPLINHPGGKYYDTEDGRNKDILLWKAVRASAAAPWLCPATTAGNLPPLALPLSNASIVSSRAAPSVSQAL